MCGDGVLTPAVARERVRDRRRQIKAKYKSEKELHPIGRRQWRAHTSPLAEEPGGGSQWPPKMTLRNRQRVKEARYSSRSPHLGGDFEGFSHISRPVAEEPTGGHAREQPTLTSAVGRWSLVLRSGLSGILRACVAHVQIHSETRSPFQFTWRMGAFSALSPISLLRTHRPNRPAFGDPEIAI